MDAVDAVVGAYSCAYAMTLGTDWNVREAEGHRSLGQLVAGVPRDAVYLGGDRLRPYLSVASQGTLYLVSRKSSELSCPRLLEEIRCGAFGFPTISNRDKQLTIVTVPFNRSLAKRLRVPRVYLLSLTNSARYQTRRYPLNISRLAQWVRFTHAGRVRVADLALTFGGNLRTLADDILSFQPQLLGISLNFGELGSLQELVSYIRSAGERPVLCLGNVLAAWATKEVRDACADYQLVIAPSYGESTLEATCIALLGRGSQERHILLPIEVQPQTFEGPFSIVFPDEHLLAETLRQGGQASLENKLWMSVWPLHFLPTRSPGKGMEAPCRARRCCCNWRYWCICDDALRSE